MMTRFFRQRPHLLRWFVYLSIAGGLLISLWIYGMLYRKALPYAFEMLEIDTQSQCRELMAATIRSLNADCESYILYDYDESGNIGSIRLDSVKINLLKSDITSLLIAKLEKMSSIQIGIPIGNMTNIDLFFGKGPKIKIMLPVRGTVKCDITDSFNDAGINQTLHKTSVKITLDLILILPDMETKTFSICENFELAQTIVVGNIPQTVIVR